MLGPITVLVVLVLLGNVRHATATTNISLLGNFDQCQPPPIFSWRADAMDRLKPPFNFLLVPIQASIPRQNNLLVKIPHTDKTWNARSHLGMFSALPTFPLSAGTQVVTVLSDANGIERVSAPFTVGSSSNSSCLTPHTITIPPTSPIFSIQTIETGCESLISWDASNPRIQSNEVSVRVVVPGSTTYKLGSRLASSGSLEWRAQINPGTKLLFAFSSVWDDGSETLLETSPLITVGSHDSSRTGCIPPPSLGLSKAKPPNHLFDGTTSQSLVKVPGMKRGEGENIPLIVGLCIGGIALLTLSGFLVYLWRVRLQQGVSLGQSSPYGQNPSRIPSSPEASWMTSSPSQPGGFPTSPSRPHGDLERGLSGGEETGSEDIASRDGRRQRKGKERERPRQQQGRQASGSTSKSNPHLLPPSYYHLHRPTGPQRGMSVGSSSGSFGPTAMDIPMPDLNMDALNNAEAADLFTGPTPLVGTSSSALQPPLSPSGYAGGSPSSPPASKRRKDSKRPRYEAIPIPELNLDALNNVEASDLFTAPALSMSPQPTSVASSSSPSHPTQE